MVLSQRLALVEAAVERGEIVIKDRDLRAIRRWLALAEGKVLGINQAAPLSTLPAA